MQVLENKIPAQSMKVILGLSVTRSILSIFQVSRVRANPANTLTPLSPPPPSLQPTNGSAAKSLIFQRLFLHKDENA